jgi:hypothetical protein
MYYKTNRWISWARLYFNFDCVIGETSHLFTDQCVKSRLVELAGGRCCVISLLDAHSKCEAYSRGKNRSVKSLKRTLLQSLPVNGDGRES